METATATTATVNVGALGRYYTPMLGFEWLGTIGYLFVPEDYQHESCLGEFQWRRRARGLDLYNKLVTDERCARVSKALRPGDRLYVSFFRNTSKTAFGIDEGLEFLWRQGAVFLGAQGLALLSEQKGGRFPTGYDCVSLDRIIRLPLDDTGHWRIPVSRYYEDETRGFELETLELESGRTAIVCFTPHQLWP